MRPSSPLRSARHHLHHHPLPPTPQIDSSTVMAKVSSAAARPASRQSQDAPQDAPAATAPARATRSTRSQSREPTEQPVTMQPASKAKGGASKRGGGRKKKQDNANNVTGMYNPQPNPSTFGNVQPSHRRHLLPSITSLVQVVHVGIGSCTETLAAMAAALAFVSSVARQRAHLHLADIHPSIRSPGRRGACRRAVGHRGQRRRRRACGR